MENRNMSNKLITVFMSIYDTIKKYVKTQNGISRIWNILNVKARKGVQSNVIQYYNKITKETNIITAGVYVGHRNLWSIYLVSGI